MTEKLWSTGEVTKATGVTSRTLRHYDQIGLLQPTQTSEHGLRWYNHSQLVQLQRILVLRELRVPLHTITQVLQGDDDPVQALKDHRRGLLAERRRLGQQIRTIETTIKSLEQGNTVMTDQMFEGFQQETYDPEVRERWGEAAADNAQRWWQELGSSGQTRFHEALESLNLAWDELIASGADPHSLQAQQIAARHVDFLADGTQTPNISKTMVQGIVQMYVDDDRFAVNYTRVSPRGAHFVRDAVHHYANEHLEG